MVSLTIIGMGVIGVTFSQGFSTTNTYFLGILSLIGVAILSGIYHNFIKSLVKRIHPFVAFTVICVLMTVIFAPWALLFGNLENITNVGSKIQLILFLSGFLSLSLSNILFYHSIKNLGVSRPASLLLAVPFLTAIFSFFILDEVLSIVQIISGILLLTGCFFLLSEEK